MFHVVRTIPKAKLRAMSYFIGSTNDLPLYFIPYILACLNTQANPTIISNSVEISNHIISPAANLKAFKCP